jgi:LPPG:FO 2-phospho-L-lactate transferase
MKITALAGGVGGAKLADGLAQCLPAADLTVIVNIGDDFEHCGLMICPDLDTVCYTLAGMANPDTGWGCASDTWNCLEELVKLGAPGWFSVGDRDLATHIERTRRLRIGESLSQVTRHFCQAWHVEQSVLPASNERVPTLVLTDDGEINFQEYFVRLGCAPQVHGFRFCGAGQAQPAEGVLAALEQAELVVICPSNPWVSIDPILALPGIKQRLVDQCVVAVSPIIGGKTVKGPAAKMFKEMGIEPSACAVAQHYQELINGMVIDEIDAIQASKIKSLDIVVLITGTMMHCSEDRKLLARQVLEFGRSLRSKGKCSHRCHSI